MRTIALSVGLSFFAPLVAFAQSSDTADLAKQLSNPVAALVSVPFQLNYDDSIGSDDSGSRWTLNVQPVIPFSISEDWNLISRTIVPFVSTDSIPLGSANEVGLGDTVQSFFFSPKAPTADGWILGAGPVLLLPTSTNDRFGAGEWGVGVSVLALRQQGEWTYGTLANHIIDVDGEIDISATLVQPFVSYTTPESWTFSINTESSYDWESEQWSIPLDANISKLVSMGNQPISISSGLRYWADGPENGPEGWGIQLGATLLFPK
jgi:hypothetical protein